MPREADLVSEISSTTGTGSAVVAGAVAGHRTWLDAFGAANTVVHYGIKHASNGTWESGIGTWLHASNAVQRDLVLASSSGGSKVSFASGGLIVYCQTPAESAKRIQISRSTDIGLEILPAASQSANLIAAKNTGGDVAFAVAPTGRVSTIKGFSCGSVLASGVNDLSSHFALWGTTYGFNVTSNRMNYNVAESAAHDIYVGSSRVGRFNSGGLEARLEHTEGYMLIHTYDETAYGIGYARLHYHANDRAIYFSSVNDGSIGTMELDLGDCSIDGDGHASIGNCFINKTPQNDIDQGKYSSEAGTTLNLQSGTDSITIFDVNALTLGNLVNAGSVTTNSGNTIMTRQKGDARYTLSSSDRFKLDQEAIEPVDLTGLALKAWQWGGDLDESHPRYGLAGSGFIAEEVQEILPEAVTYDQDTGLVQGLDPLCLIAHAIRHFDARLRALEA